MDAKSIKRELTKWVEEHVDYILTCGITRRELNTVSGDEEYSQEELEQHIYDFDGTACDASPAEWDNLLTAPWFRKLVTLQARCNALE